jgi:hypothetical protein
VSTSKQGQSQHWLPIFSKLLVLHDYRNIYTSGSVSAISFFQKNALQEAQWWQEQLQPR